MKTLSQLIGEAVGQASGCWTNLSGAGTFDTTGATEVAQQLEKDIREHQYQAEMKLSRNQVYTLIDGERAYQDSMWNPETTPTGGLHSPMEWLVHISIYAQEAMQVGTHESDATARDKELAAIRKIAAMAVACMENHGAPARQPKVVTPRTY